MRNRLQFWQVYVGAGIVTILVIGVTIYWNFFGPYRPAEPQLQYATAQLVFTAVGILGIIFSLLFATHQFAQSQRKPDLKREDERVVYDVVVELLERKPLSQTSYDRLVKQFGLDLAIEIVTVAGLYSMVATVLNGFDVPTPNGEQPFN